ncbi:hypothetical protein [Pseudozobellia thermophila]|uniref:Uncharacterized protein n=1 Tax=Pseudozobellia thermophila TaxID=192903 RepID=A0A1M6P5C3_9FLAO|nr:hypothetical protein [Pseudozobellia thermophila]SHK03144.1 hypothetical protein SAMN04488513_11817 [Pseudozobellia thermophila]
MKAILRYLLASCYSFSRRWVNPKYGGDVMWTTVHGFLTPISFIAVGIYTVVLNFTGANKWYDDSWPYILGAACIMLPIGYGLQKPTRRALSNWGIIKEFKTLTKKQRRSRNTMAFLFFFFGFICFFTLLINQVLCIVLFNGSLIYTIWL